MNNEEDNYIKISKNHAITILIIINMVPLYLSLHVFYRIPIMKKVCEELLAGEPMPLITQYLLTVYSWLWIIPLFLILISYALKYYKNMPPSVPFIIGVVSVIMTFLLKEFITEGVAAPFFNILHKLS